ncbi:MAG: hypothetical protein QOK14_682 [Frankiaceae bacterium]|nr:hypothetical protein [Frankiaceae bacterium]
MTCSAFRDDLGAYALDTLAAPDRAAVDGHLGACGDCRDELAGFAELPALLSRTTAADITSAVGPAPDLLSRTLATVRARRRRRIWLSAAAACVVVAVAAGATAELVRESPPPARVVVEAVDPASHVHARVSYVAAGAGTNLWLTLDGVASGERCELIAVGPNGSREVAATWEASYAGQANVQGMTALKVDALTGFEIATTDGRHLVWVGAAKPS